MKKCYNQAIARIVVSIVFVSTICSQFPVTISEAKETVQNMTEIFDEKATPSLLDEQYLDDQGIFYTLDDNTMTAMVGDGTTTSANSKFQGNENGEKADVIIPSAVQYNQKIYIVRTIGCRAFYGSQKVKSMTIADSVVTLGEDAFSYCSMEFIYIGKRVSSIEDTFTYSNQIGAFKVSKDNHYFRSFQDVLFNYDMTTLIKFPGKKDFGEDRVYKVPDCVECIGENAFYSTTNLDYVIMGKKTEEISDYAFGNSALLGMDVSEVKEISSSAFPGSKIAWIKLSDSCNLSKHSLYYMTYLNTLYYTGKTENINKSYSYFLGNCSNLENLIFAPGTQLMDYTCRGCSKLKFVSLPNDLVTIPEYAFYQCTELDKIYIPASVKNINKTAFYNCASLTIYGESGSAVETFADKYAFDFVSMDEHVHDVQETTFLNNGYIKISGKVCSDCGYAIDCELTDIVNLSTLVTQEEPLPVIDTYDPTPTEINTDSCEALNSEMMDKQRLFYTLDESVLTASVSDQYYDGGYDGKVTIPAVVTYNNKEYHVNTIDIRSPWVTSLVIADTVSKIQNIRGSKLEYLYIGENIGVGVDGQVTSCNWPNLIKIDVSNKNHWLTALDGVLYSKNMQYLYNYPARRKRDIYQIPIGVCHIGIRAFYHAQIKRISLPSTVNELASYSFSDSTIKYINLDQVENIGKEAFENCTKLTYINLQNVQSVGNQAFRYCSEIKAIEVSGSNSFGFEVFSDQSSLETLIIKGNSTFSLEGLANCSSLKYVSLGEKIEAINRTMFYNCKSLEQIYIPSSVGNIASDSFSGCTVTISGRTGELSETAALEGGFGFYDVDEHLHHLQQITFLSNDYVTLTGEICPNCGYICDTNTDVIEEEQQELVPVDEVVETLDVDNKDSQGIFYTLNEEKLTANVGKTGVINSSEYDGANDGVVIIPDYVMKNEKKYLVNTISSYAFYKNSTIKSIDISDQVTVIQSDAFCYSSLQEMNIGKGLQTLIENALAGMDKLKKIEVDASNPYFAEQAGILFSADKSTLWLFPADDEMERTSYDIPWNTKKIACSSFNYTDLDYVTISKAITEVPEYAFLYSALKGIDLKGMTKVGSAAFSGCKELKWICLDGITSVADSTFNGCSSLEAVVLSSTLSISVDLFSGCTKLTTIILTDVSRINSEGLSGLSSLSYVSLPNTLTTIGDNAFQNDTLLKRIYIPNTVTTIAETAFSGCSELTIYGEKNSAAHKFAALNDFNFVSVSDHVHQFVQYEFYRSDVFCITGDFCEECSCASGCVWNYVTDPAIPTPEPATPTPSPATPTPSPATPTPEPATPTPEPATPTPATPTPTPAIPTPEPATPTPMPSIEEQQIKITSLAIKGFRVINLDNRLIKLSWSANKECAGYCIYRSTSANKGFVLKKKVTSKYKNSFTDTNVKPMTKYFYKVCAVYSLKSAGVGKFTKVLSKKVTGLQTPAIILTKKVTQTVKMISISLKKYSGKYVDIFVAINKEKFKKIKLTSNSIKKYKGNFVLQYLVENALLKVKVKTYVIVKKKKVFSNWSKVMKIKT